MTIKNPWLDVPDVAPFVLAADREGIARFNRTASEETRVDLNLLPEPFQGNPEAHIVLLGLNPGLSIEDAGIHEEGGFAKRLRANHAHERADFPFYLLHPEVKGPGRRWWERRLRRLLEIAPRQVVAQQLLCIEYFPYHSVRFGARLRVPSQEYGFHLAGEAIRRRAVVIVMRSRRLWEAAVPQLAAYDRAFSLRSVQNISVTPRNCPEGFPAIVEALRSSTPWGP
jgi:hypothetical protein